MDCLCQESQTTEPGRTLSKIWPTYKGLHSYRLDNERAARELVENKALGREKRPQYSYESCRSRGVGKNATLCRRRVGASLWLRGKRKRRIKKNRSGAGSPGVQEQVESYDPGEGAVAVQKFSMISSRPRQWVAGPSTSHDT